MLAFAFVIAALVLFILAALKSPSESRVNLTAAGLALFMGAELATRFGHW